MDESRRFQVAMVIYAVLAVLAWILMSDERIPIGSGGISFRGLTLAVLALFAVRTIFLWRARMRGESDDDPVLIGNGGTGFRRWTLAVLAISAVWKALLGRDRARSESNEEDGF